MDSETQLRLKSAIRDVPDFPKPGILFKDITPLLQSPELFRLSIETLSNELEKLKPTTIVAIESRGFLFGAPLALHLGCRLSIVRKPNKLPYKRERVEYALEYGTDALEMHIDAVSPGEKVVILDDVLATGGTARATVDLVSRLRGEVMATAFVIELGFLKGRNALGRTPVVSLLKY